MAMIGKIFPSTYVSAGDLKGDTTVTIDRVNDTEVVDEKTGETAPIVYFVGTKKGWRLNQTNAKTVVKITGEPNTDDWGGHKITLFPTQTDMKGEQVACIRVRLKTVDNRPDVPATGPVDDDLDDEIPW